MGERGRGPGTPPPGGGGRGGPERFPFLLHWSAEPAEFFERGDQVAVVVKGRTQPKGSSAELELRNGAVWTIRDGTVVSVRLFANPEEALEAAGLAE